MFLKNPRKLTMKQANIIENFAETFTNNKAKNKTKISDEIGKKLETITTNSSINKIIKQAGESHPPSENELTLDGNSDLDKQIGQLVDTTKNAQVNFAINNGGSESGQRDENELIKDISNDFSEVEKKRSNNRKKWLI